MAITRGRACAIVRQADRLLLNRYGGDSFWALPGGAVEQGEFSTDALVRELREELGITIEVGRLLWIVENLFDYRGTSYTEYGFCYEADWPGAVAIGDAEFAGEEPDQFFVGSGTRTSPHWISGPRCCGCRCWRT